MIRDVLVDSEMDIAQLRLGEVTNDSGGPFDPTLEITREQWENFQEVLANEFHNGDENAIDLAKTFVFLGQPINPETLALLEEALLKQIRDSYNFDSDTLEHAQRKSGALASIKLLLPGKYKHYSNEYSNWIKMGLHDSLDRRTAARHSLSVLEVAVKYWILEGASPTLKEDTIKVIKTSIVNERRAQAERSNYWDDYLTELYWTKLAFPGIYRELAPISSDWSIFRGVLDMYKDLGLDPQYLDLAAKLRVLAAKEINITPNGLELIMGVDSVLDQSQEQIPPRREY